MHKDQSVRRGPGCGCASPRRLFAGIVCACALLASGCGTIDSQCNYWSGEHYEGAGIPRVYIFGGAVNDAYWGSMLVSAPHCGNQELYLLVPFLFIDFPLSLGLDAVLLPLTIGEQIEAAVHAPP